MQATQALWHIAAFLGPAVLLGGLSALATRLIWRRELAGRSVWRLWLWAGAAAAIASFVGLLVTGADGRVATYAAMVLACAIALWWAAFGAAGR